jgi:hypothetical protein
MDADSRILRAGAAGHFLIRSGWSPSGPCRCPACAGPVPCGHVLRIPPRWRGRPGRLQPDAHRGQRGGAEPLPYRRAVCRRHGPHGQDWLRHRRPRAPPQPQNRAGGRGLPALRAAIPCHRAHARQRGRYLARLQRMGPATRQAPLRCHATRLAHREPGSREPEIRGSAHKAAPRRASDFSLRSYRQGPSGMAWRVTRETLHAPGSACAASSPAAEAKALVIPCSARRGVANLSTAIPSITAEVCVSASAGHGVW